MISFDEVLFGVIGSRLGGATGGSFVFASPKARRRAIWSLIGYGFVHEVSHLFQLQRNLERTKWPGADSLLQLLDTCF